jgi:hypothetical protein
MSTANNPYSPPKADPGSGPAGERPTARPRALDMAVTLIALQALLVASDALGSWSQVENGVMTGFMFLEICIRAIVLVWICFAIFRGRNWARIVLVILTLLGLFSLGVALMAWHRMGMNYSYLENGPRWLFMLVLPSALYLAACYLVFFPGRGWFAKRTEGG